MLQLLVLSCQRLLRSVGYYRLILYAFYMEAGLAAVVLALGPQHYYLLAFFLTFTMYVIQQLVAFPTPPRCRHAAHPDRLLSRAGF